MTFGKRLAWSALHELSEYIALAHYQATSLVSQWNFTKDKKGQNMNLNILRALRIKTFVWSKVEMIL